MVTLKKVVAKGTKLPLHFPGFESFSAHREPLNEVHLNDLRVVLGLRRKVAL